MNQLAADNRKSETIIKKVKEQAAKKLSLWIRSIAPKVGGMLAAVALILAVVAMVLLIHSRHGRNMIAIREEELASQAIGINVFRYKMISFAISAAYAAIGGAMYAHYLGYLQPLMFQLTKSTELTIMVIFGGLGSIGGSVVGAFFLTFIPELFRAFASWRLVIYGAAVILVMITCPQGLMGGREFTDVFRWIKKKLTGKKDENAAVLQEKGGQR